MKENIKGKGKKSLLLLDLHMKVIFTKTESMALEYIKLQMVQNIQDNLEMENLKDKENCQEKMATVMKESGKIIKSMGKV